MPLISFIISFSIFYLAIDWAQNYVKKDIQYLKKLLILFCSVPIINFIVLFLIGHYVIISLLLKLEILEYVEHK